MTCTRARRTEIDLPPQKLNLVIVVVVECGLVFELEKLLPARPSTPLAAKVLTQATSNQQLEINQSPTATCN